MLSYNKFLIALLCIVFTISVKGELNDPTRPPAFISEAISNGAGDLKTLKLQSIVIGQHRKHAVINDKIVKEGDWIAGSKVVEIRANSVVLQKEQDAFITLELIRYTIKKIK